MKKILLAGLALALLTTTAIASKNESSGRGSGGMISISAVLTPEQLDTLVFIYQEEKVARDTYVTLGKLYPHQKVFENIQISEQEHIDKARVLCENYGADISSIDEQNVGVFSLPVLQELYDTLVAQGSISELASLNVGEYIELTDIDDLEHAQTGMPSDVVKVFENLKAGSLNHLDAFRKAIDAYNSSI